MFPNILDENKSRKNLVGTELDTDLSKKLYTTYQPAGEVTKGEVQSEKSFVELPHDIDLTFAQNFIAKDGKFVYCTSLNELKTKLNHFFSNNGLQTAFVWEENLLSLIKSETCDPNYKIERVIDHAKVAISFCESLVADEGTIILNPNQNRFRPLDNFPQYHVILASKKMLRKNIEHAVSDYVLKHPEVFPFLIDLSKEDRNTRFAMNKPILNSRGTKNVIIFYCEECSF